MIRAAGTVNDKAVMQALRALQTDVNHKPDRLAKAVGEHVLALVREYFAEEKGTDHRTATRLGAKPTHFYKRKSRQVSLSVVDGQAVIFMPRAGVSRAFSTYILKPTRGRVLMTIP